jgi:hypothetical protein
MTPPPSKLTVGNTPSFFNPEMDLSSSFFFVTPFFDPAAKNHHGIHMLEDSGGIQSTYFWKGVPKTCRFL